MVLASLEPNDPQPRRDDPRFGGDYKEFRKADKAWSKRESKRRKVLEERTLPAETTLVTSAEAGDVAAPTGTAPARSKAFGHGIQGHAGRHHFLAEWCALGTTLAAPGSMRLVRCTWLDRAQRARQTRGRSRQRNAN